MKYRCSNADASLLITPERSVTNQTDGMRSLEAGTPYSYTEIDELYLLCSRARTGGKQGKFSHHLSSVLNPAPLWKARQYGASLLSTFSHLYGSIKYSVQQNKNCSPTLLFIVVVQFIAAIYVFLCLYETRTE